MKRISLIGATGSIGRNVVDVVQHNPQLFSVISFSFYNNIELGEQLIKELSPIYVAVKDEKIAYDLSKKYPQISFGYGMKGLIDAVTLTDVDVVLNAVMGSIGLEPTLAAINHKKDIALANKETLVMGGELVMQALEKSGSRILPVDSEHSAIFQCLQGQEIENVDHLVITASGGSFRDFSREELKEVTVEQALAHPNWSMGKKITIDSSTMMNKGLEVIEARWLFGLDYDKIKVILHRESIVHSMVVLKDGAYLAQLGASDMREPIQFALTYPNRLPIQQPKSFDLTTIGSLHFEVMDFERFPLLSLAYHVGKIGGTMPTVYNAANEIVVEAFLTKQIPYLAIEDIVERFVHDHNHQNVLGLEQLMEVDKRTRKEVRAYIERRV